MKEKPILIKRYSNRKLYNTETSKYVNCEEVMNLFFDGIEFEIWEVRNGETTTEVTHLALINWVTEKYRETLEGKSFKDLREIAMASGRSTPKKWSFYQELYKGKQKHFEKQAYKTNPSHKKEFSIREMNRALQIKDSINTKRNCLRCREVFESKSVCNRICPLCKKDQNYHRQDSASYALAEQNGIT